MTRTTLPLPLLVLSLLLSLYPSQGSTLTCGSSNHGSSSTLEVMHVYSPCSPFRPKQALSWEQSILDLAAKDEARLLYLSNLVARKSVVPVASGRQIIQSPTYIVRARFGTPAQPMFVAMDTSSDVAWIPCTGCVGCSSTVFNTARSTTYKPTGCSAPQCSQVPNPTCGGAACFFNLTYGSSTIAATVSQDRLVLATDPIPNYSFGCIKAATGNSIPPQGLLGLGRGPMSLLSQTKSLYQSTFSYCLPDFRSANFSGQLRLGPVAQPIRIKFTPLLTNPRRSSLYYVNMIGISVGRRLVNIPPSALAFNPTTGAGTIFDSGTVFTRLVQPAYIAVRDEFRRRIKAGPVSSLGGFDTCYMQPVVSPTITLHFTGMNVTLPQNNFLIHSTAGSITCLAMAATPDNVNSVLNVIANMQQQNHRVLYDVPNSRLGVARELCTH
ncbi:aspartyl protease AED3-like [Macadamia integrifolia]|uniref:aspartyl protease AED3-like n=1 Tax=Macadamia integrifolia TaxID=60698 RepID=UPI001C5278A7|nr:aspartyl protease AED3-like [Macadamia integrifolia]